MILNEKYLHKILTSVLKEELEYDEELSQYDEYVKGYDDFDPSEVDINELLSFVQRSGDFLYYYNYNMHSANSVEIVNEIADEIQNYGAEITHEIDDTLEWDWDKYFGNDEIYLVIFKVIPSNGKPFYILYNRNKYDIPYSMKDDDEYDY